MKNNLEKQLHTLGQKLPVDEALLTAGKQEVVEAIKNLPPGGGLPPSAPILLTTQNIAIAALGTVALLGGILAYLFAQEGGPSNTPSANEQGAAVMESAIDAAEQTSKEQPADPVATSTAEQGTGSNQSADVTTEDVSKDKDESDEEDKGNNGKRRNNRKYHEQQHGEFIKETGSPWPESDY